MFSVPNDMLLGGVYMKLPNTLFIKNKTKKTKKRSLRSGEPFCKIFKLIKYLNLET